MVFSVRANKKRIIAVLVVLAIVICGIIVLPKMVMAPLKQYGETPVQRAEFLKSYGWEISEEPIDSREVTIPGTFNEVYAKYNVMQKAQGFDLKPYSGLNCTQYIYQIKNYTGSDRQVHATLLVYEGIIVGGDVSCAEVDGFMHGFAADSARYGASPVKKDAVAATATPKPVEKTDVSPENQETGGEVIEEFPLEETAGHVDPEDAPAEETAGDPVPTEEDYPTD